MSGYHVTSTGSQRSVGPRRIKKLYEFSDGSVVESRSPFGARRLARKLAEAPKPITHFSVLSATAEDTETPTATLTITGSPTKTGGTITLAAYAGSDIFGLNVLSFDRGTTVNELASAIAAELDGKQNEFETVTIQASANGSVITVTEAGGDNIDTLSATFG